ncbi:PLP-dependent aminotransferase family protein [Kribbella sp. NPDC026611]|uniref:MocR-like pyridoxine biosynthesis transcription factor PdxR n=1 Tax=Kribbella sp. NPDC026611 TaxID=3154911 RepID=UPI0033C06B46
MELRIELAGRGDLAGQIRDQIAGLVKQGLLRADDRIPSSRELAARLGVSRTTVATAYEQLTADGFLQARTGVGTYIRNPTVEPPTLSRLTGGPEPQPIWAGLHDPEDLSAAAPRFDLRAGIPDARSFPFATWRAAVADQFRPNVVGTAAYGDPAGDPGLRTAVARHVAVSRSVRGGPDDVLITNGIQQAIDLIARVVLKPGDVVAVEDPGYGPPRVLFRSLGLRVVGVPVDDEGLVVDALPADARLVYVTPAHQFPLGVPLSAQRRTALLEWAARTGATIVEDDYDSEFRFAGRPLEPLQSLDRDGSVIYVGSFSKIMLPTIRLGFLVAPPSLYGALRKAKWLTDWHTALPLQRALATFIENGHLAHHLRRMRRTYAQRHHHLQAALHTAFDGTLCPLPSLAGLHVAVRSPEPTYDDTALAARATELGVGLLPLSYHAVDPQPRVTGLILGYGAIEQNRIDEALALLKQCL